MAVRDFHAPQLKEAMATYLKIVQPATAKDVLEAVRNGKAHRFKDTLVPALPGRLNMPERAPGAKEATEAKAKPRTSVEPIPLEFQALRDTKRVNSDTDAAANRLGFTSEDLYQFAYVKLATHSVEGEGHRGQHSDIFGLLAEPALAASEEMKAVESKAVNSALTDTLGLKPIDYEAVQEAVIQEAKTHEVPRYSVIFETPAEAAVSALRLLSRYRPAADVLDVELYTVRDINGQLVTDRLRGLLDLRNKGKPKFVVISIGEAKAKSGRYKIIPQLVEDVRRLLEGFGIEGVEFGEDDVVFGKQLVLGWLSEKPPSKTQVDEIRSSTVKNFTDQNKALTSAGKPTAAAPEVIPCEVAARTTFDDARKVTSDFQAALNALASQNPPTDKK